MKTDDEMREHFMHTAGLVLADNLPDHKADEFAEFITKNRVRLAEVVPAFNEKCSILSAFYVEKAEMILQRRMRCNGCGECAGCKLLAKARGQLYGN